jgi:hypothetical protein
MGCEAAPTSDAGHTKPPAFLDAVVPVLVLIGLPYTP